MLPEVTNKKSVQALVMSARDIFHNAVKAALQIERQILFDVERDHYQVVNTGWENRRRVFGCLIHVDIKGEKLWIQYDGTEVGVANELVKSGIPKQDI